MNTEKLRVFAPDLNRIAPRSPYAALGEEFPVCGARLVDKCRAELLGQNGSYHYNCPMDRKFFEATGLEAEPVRKVIATGAVALCWPVLSAFIRIGTNTRLHKRPLTLKEAVERVQSWLDQPCVRILTPTDHHWAIFQRMLLAGNATANLVSDAQLAALRGTQLQASFDRHGLCPFSRPQVAQPDHEQMKRWRIFGSSKPPTGILRMPQAVKFSRWAHGVLFIALCFICVGRALADRVRGDGIHRGPAALWTVRDRQAPQTLRVRNNNA